MKLGFTGTQDGMSNQQIIAVRHLLSALRPEEIHAGDCIGADTEFYRLSKELFPDIITIGHVPSNNSKRSMLNYTQERNAKPYLDRNRDIVNESDQMIATPKGFEEELRSGTWMTIRYAKSTNTPLIIVYPDGSIVETP